MPILHLQGSIKRFVRGIREYETPDNALYYLKHLVRDILSYCDYYECNPVELLSLILDCDEVQYALRPLSDNIESLRALVRSNPRYQALRPYLDVISGKLSRLRAESSINLETYTRDSSSDIAIDHQGRRWIKIKVEFEEDETSRYTNSLFIVPLIKPRCWRLTRKLAKTVYSTLSKRLHRVGDLLVVLLITSLIIAIGYIIFTYYRIDSPREEQYMIVNNIIVRVSFR